MSVYNFLVSPFRESPKIHRNIMRAQILSISIKDVLEIGPGNAPLITCLKNLPKQNKYAIDFPNAIEKCRKLEYQCIEQDLSKDRWKLPDECVDLVVASMVLEHIPDTDFVLQEIYRVLRPGGHVLINVPNQGALIYILMLLLTLNPPMNMVSNRYYGLGNPLSKSRFKQSNEFETQAYGHLRLFTTRAMNDLLHIHGFKVIFNHGATWGVPVIGELLARIFPYYGVCTIVKARKQYDNGL